MRPIIALINCLAGLRSIPTFINTWLQPGDRATELVPAVSTAFGNRKLLKQFKFTSPFRTGLKPGVTERILISLLIVGFGISSFAAETNAPADAEAAYTKTITQRADKIVAALGPADTNHAAQVRDIITQQYRDLNEIHAIRDTKIKTAKAVTSDKAAVDLATQKAREEAKPKLDELHGEFLSKLSTKLTPEQVDKVKDGLTYGVVPLTYRTYLNMYPDLKDEEKKQVMAFLVEAREIAMDGSTSDEKHAVFGKYKGKINNYLSKAGYDAKKGQQNLKKSSTPPSDTKSK